MKRKILTLVLAAILFLLSLGLTLYPVISNFVNQKYASEIHTAYQEVIEQTDNTELLKARELAVSYNKAITPGTTTEDAYSQEALLAASEDYNSQLTGFQQLCVVGLLDDFLIGGVDFRCVLLVYEIADDRIQRQPQRKQEQDRRQHQSQNFAFHSELPIP